MVGLAWLNYPESYASGSVATGTAYHAGQVKGDEPDEKGYPVLPGWVLGMKPTTSPRKRVYVEKPSKMPRMGLINKSNRKLKELLKGDIYNIFFSWIDSPSRPRPPL